MAFTKYASFEVSEILGIKGSADQKRTATLDKFADYKDYRTDDGYLYARIIAISSRVNKNNDGWPSVELAGGQKFWDERVQPALDKHGSVILEADPKMKTGYSTFVGKPHFVDHHNSDTKRARGVIVDSKLRVQAAKTSGLDPYYSSEEVDDEHLPPTQVELLIEVDAKSFPMLAKAIVDGSQDASKGIDGFSMGCDVAKSKCSHCGNEASSPREYCSHIKMKGAEHKVISGKHAGRSRKSYENCYGIKFFEISAVFDPADETALLQELIDENPEHVSKVAVRGDDVVREPCSDCFGSGSLSDGNTCPTCQGTGTTGRSAYTPENAGDEGVYMPANGQQTNVGEVGGLYQGQPSYEGPIMHYPQDSYAAPHLVTRPENAPVGAPDFAPGSPLLEQIRQRIQMNKPLLSSTHSYLQARTTAVKEADNPLPQSMHTTAPEKVDTLREEKICPVCGENMEGEKCQTCGHIEPPDGLNNPDLHAPDLTTPDMPGVDQDEAPNSEQGGVLDGAPAPGEASGVSYLQSRKKSLSPGVTGAATVTAGKIKTVERPLKSAQTPATDEPNEAVVSDQDRPVTSTFRTAMDLIQAANSNRKNNMSDQNKIAAEAPSGVGAQKRVDVEGVGGVIDATNEKASKPDGAQSYENAGTTTTVDGKGGIIEDSNAEASKPSQGSESLPTAGRDSDDSGFNKDKNIPTDSQKTRTFDNSNEPGSAVTDKAFPTAAKKGVQPISGPGVFDTKPQTRVNLEDDEFADLRGTPTSQWTGTGGNGVTRQQDPVTKKVDPNITVSAFSHVVAAMKLADAEVELGILDKDNKYDRVAELEALTPEELAAEERVVSRVKTAGLAKKTATRREAATRPGEVTNVPPAFSKQAGSIEPKKAQQVDDTLGDAALFLR